MGEEKSEFPKGETKRRAVLSGNLSAAQDVSNKVLRVFISSTFADTQAERNYLMREIYPQIRRFCEERGLEFSVVDFRWGIRDHATNSHKGTEICLAEVDRCFRESVPGPCFVLLSFNRYGWVPLPRIVKAAEFEAILGDITEEGDKQTVLMSYKKDENAVPAEYVLQQITKQVVDIESDEGKPDTRACLQKWWDIQDKLQSILCKLALSSASLSEGEKIKWKASVTEHEIRQALLEHEDGRLRSFVLRRDFENLQEISLSKEHSALGVYVDKSQKEIADVRKIYQELKVTTEHFSLPWQEGGPQESSHKDYICRFGQVFKDHMTSLIQQTLDETQADDELTFEVATHSMFCAKRGKNFVGRTSLVEDGMKYFKQQNGNTAPLIVHGMSGSGKTSFLSKLAVEAKSLFDQRMDASPTFVVRYCGTTPHSSSAFSLMKSISAQLNEIYDTKGINLSVPYNELVNAFHKCISAATKDNPLLIFIDSLDQLSDENQGRSQLKWIPDKLPANVYMVVSTLPDIGGCLEDLRRKEITEDNYLQVQPITAEESSDILGSLMQRANRSLTYDQRKYVENLSVDRSAEEPTLLRLRLLLDIAIQTASYDKLEGIPKTVTGLIGKYFEEIEQEHGKLFVSTIFGLLGTSKHGLSENDLLDMLSSCEDVLNEVLTYHEPPVRRVPQVVLARLRNDLGDYVVERGAYGKPVLAWYHRQFWQTANARYLANGCQRFATILRSYFSGELHGKFLERQLSEQPYYWKDEKGNVRFNAHKLSELASAAVKENDPEIIETTLCDLEFIAGSLEAGLGRDLVANFKRALQPCQSPGKLKEFSNFIASQIHFLEDNPRFLLQRAFNCPNSNSVYQEALTFIDEPGRLTPWEVNVMQKVVKYVNKPTEEQPCLMTMDENVDEITKLVLLGEHFLVSVCKGKKILVWNLDTGIIVKRIHFLKEVRDVAVVGVGGEQDTKKYEQSDGSLHIHLLCACMDGMIYIYKVLIKDLINTELIYKWKAYDPPFTDIMVLAKDDSYQCVVSGISKEGISYEGGRISIWNIANFPDQATLLRTKPLDVMLENFEETKTFRNGCLHSISLLSSTRWLAVGIRQHRVASNIHSFLCDLSDLEIKFEIARGCSSFLVSHKADNGTHIVVSGPDGLSWIGLSEDNELTECQVLHTQLPEGAQFLLTESHLLATGSNVVTVYGAEDPFQLKIDQSSHNYVNSVKIIGVIIGHGSSMTACDIFGDLFVTASEDGVINLWDMARLKFYDSSKYHNGAVKYCCLLDSEDGNVKTLTSSDKDADSREWVSVSGELIEEAIITKSTLSSRSEFFFSYEGKGQLSFRGVDELKTTRLYLPVYTLQQLSLSGDNGHLSAYSVTSKSFFVVNAANKGYYQIPLSSFPMHLTESLGSLFLPNSQVLILWGSTELRKEGLQTAIYKIDLEEGKAMKRRKFGEKKLLRDGFLICKYENPIQSFRYLHLDPFGNFELIKIIGSITVEPATRITCASPIPQKQSVAFGTETGVIQIRHKETLQPLHEVSTHKAAVTCINTTDDGRYLVTGSCDGWVRVFNTGDYSEISSFFNTTEITCLEAFVLPQKNMIINAGDGIGQFKVLEILDTK